MRLFNKINMNYNCIIKRVSVFFDSSFSICICVLIYKGLLDFIYCNYIAGYYTFFGLQYSPINIINGWLSVIIILPIISFFYKQKLCSSIIMVALNLLYFIPITTYCGYGGGSSSFLFFAVIYWLILSALQIKVPVISYKRNNVNFSDSVLYGAIIAVSIFSIYIWWKYTGCRIQINVFDVYNIRAEAARYDLPILLNYGRHISTIIVSMLILLVLHKRKYILLIWLLFITLINFSFAGNKSIILFPVILIGGYIFYRKEAINLMFPLGIIVELLAILEHKCGSALMISFIFRRQGLVLAQLSDSFYRFFSENPTDIFRSSIIGKFGFDSIYNQPLAQVIGNNFESQVVNCNNGLLADVWSGLGYIGIIIMPIVLIICFRLLDFVSYKIDHRLTIGLVLYYAIMFANSSWSTVLLTHGYIVMCIILFIFPRRDSEVGVVYESKRNII